MNETIRKARETLARAEKTLAESRNRHRFDVQEWGERMPDDPHQMKAWLAELPEPDSVTAPNIATPVVRKINKEARVSRSMDPDSSKAWNDWARKIAQRETLHACEVIGKQLGALLRARDDRIAALEAEVDRLKQRQPAPAEEWPVSLRSVQGGKS